MPMPRGSSSTTPYTRRRTARARSEAVSVVGQITQLVAANESLKLENAKLHALNEQLRGELTEIGSALGSLTGGRRGRGRRGAAALALPEAKPRRQRKPIKDPEVLARRNVALAKARAARAERLTAARAGHTQPISYFPRKNSLDHPGRCGGAGRRQTRRAVAIERRP
jgi:hypothetical protein